MRQAINENKTIQIALVGVLAVVAVLMLMTRMKSASGGGEATPPPDTGAVSGAVTGDSGAAGPDTSGASGAGLAPTTSSTASGAPTTGVTASATGSLPTAGVSSTGSGASGSVSPQALIPGPGLPRQVITAFAKGDAIVLLIVRGGGTDDKLVRQSVTALSEPGIAVFVARAKDIARYSRITQGVGVSQVPALVVVRPRSVSGSTPQAEVSYGFRNSQSVVQAVNDALYKGRDDLPYSPR